MENISLRSQLYEMVVLTKSSKDEANIQTLLLSLTNLCSINKDLFICFPPVATQNGEDKNNLESAGNALLFFYRQITDVFFKVFVAWLLGELISIEGSEKIHLANVKLSAIIFQIMATRNFDAFLLLYEDYINIGLKCSEVLHHGQCVDIAPFSSFFMLFNNATKPHTISFSEESYLPDRILATVVLVSSKISVYVNLYCSEYLPKLWLVICLGLDAGDYSLKLSCLEACNTLIKNIGLIQRSDIQKDLFPLIQEMLSLYLSNELDILKDEIKNKVVIFLKNIRKYVSSIHISVAEDLTLDLFSSMPKILIDCDGIFRSEILQTFVLLCTSLSSSIPVNTVQNQFIDLIYKYAHVPEVTKFGLQMAVEKAYSAVYCNSLKSSNNCLSVEHSILPVFEYSLWTNSLDFVIKTMNVWRVNKTILFDSDLFESVNNIVSVPIHLNISSNKMCCELFESSWLETYTALFVDLVGITKDSNECKMLLEFFFKVVWSTLNIEGHFAEGLYHIWLGLASLPWIAQEVKPYDLKIAGTPIVKLLDSISWNIDKEIKALSVKFIAAFDSSVAPLWCCQVIRMILTEQEHSVLLQLSQSLPLISHNLYSLGGGKQLINECIDCILSANEPDLILALLSSLKQLICSISQDTCLNRLDSESEPLMCTACTSNINENCKKVEAAFIIKVLNTVDIEKEDLLLAAITSLPSIVRHTVVTGAVLSVYLKMFKSTNLNVLRILCQHLPLLLKISYSEVADSQKVGMSCGETILMYLAENFNSSDDPDSSINVKMAVLEVLRTLIICEMDNKLSSIVFVLLLHGLINSSRVVSAFSHLLLIDWARQLKLSLQDLYIQHRHIAGKNLAILITPGNIVKDFSHIAEVFMWLPENRKNRGNTLSALLAFVSSQIRHLLPVFINRASNESNISIIQELSQCLGIRLRDLIIDQFQHILAYLVLNCSEEEKNIVLQFVTTSTEIPVQNIRKCSIQNQVNELILGLHNERDKVLNELLYMMELDKADFCENDAPKKKRRRKSLLEQVSIFLAPRLLGILGFLDNKIVLSSTLQWERYAALWALNDLMTVMGKGHISPAARKILATMKTAEKFRDETMDDMFCSLWISFLQNLDSNTLEGLVEELILTIMPLIISNSEKIAPVLNEILFQNTSVISLLGNLPLFPLLPCYEKINNKIAELHANFESQSVSHKISSIIRGLEQESMEVRTNTLAHFKSVLINDQAEVYKNLLSAEASQSELSQLFALLLGECCLRKEDNQVLVAECLGLLGAIDPSRLHTPFNIMEELLKIHLNFLSENFIINLLTELRRAFLAATDASKQTCACYALQEILRIYNIKPSSGNGTSSGSSVWKSLPHQLREILSPLLNSKYTVTTNANKSSLTSPYFGNLQIQSFHQWVTIWSISLVDLVQEKIPKQVFSACKPIMRRDTTTAIFLLPHILTCVIKESSNYHDLLMNEILAVVSCTKGVEVVDSGNCISASVKEYRHLAVQTVFSLYDYINKWTHKLRQEEINSRKRNKFVTSNSSSEALNLVSSFLKKIPCDIFAETSFHSQAYSRALLHLEMYLSKVPTDLNKHLKFLQKIYVALDEPDGVAGIASIKQDEPSLHEQIIWHEAIGRLQDALGCYERLCAMEGSEETYKGLVRCYLNLNQPHSVLNITRGIISFKPKLQSTLNEYQVEAAWRLGQWDKLDDFLLCSSSEASWGVGVAKILNSVWKNDFQTYASSLQQIRSQQISFLAAASLEKGSFGKAYPYIVKLHMLGELEDIISGLLNFSEESNSDALFSVHKDHAKLREITLQKLTEKWQYRINFVQTSHRFLEPILTFRRMLLELTCDLLKSSNADLAALLHNEVCKTWLQSAKVARKAGHLQQGAWALLGAGSGKNVFMEKAKWQWLKGEKHQSVITLNRGIDMFYSNSDRENKEIFNENDIATCASAKLLLAQYSEDLQIVDITTMRQLYKDVYETNKAWEDGHFYFAMHLDRVLNTVEHKGTPVDWFYHIIMSFGKSLNYGCKHLYQSLPRMLSIWLDFGSKVADLGRPGSRVSDADKSEKISSQIPVYREKLMAMNTYLSELLQKLPLYLFFTALPQLISRICHSHAAVFKVLAEIIAELLCTYPQQTMWYMISVSKSSYQTRVRRCTEIFEIAKKKNSMLCKFIGDATKLADKLLELSNRQVDKSSPTVSLNAILRSLPRLLADSSFSEIILPFQNQMTVTLPGSADVYSSHKPFPGNPIFLVGVEDTIEILQSLQKPKKITLKGSDGKYYIVMCKAKDDLRKDCRLMEFNFFVNKLLMRNPESRKRNLKIRTYSVIPLNEECGLIEWVPNLHGLRLILNKLFREAGMCMSSTELRENWYDHSTALAKKREIFLTKYLPRHPPLLGEWFLRTFPQPQAWFMARLAYCRTAGVMSIVGYVLGLGDRHGENVLLDSSCGDTVHVDFNCLFNKGMTFDWPEKVPFRMTHNMVAAMGPTGIEGLYRKSCEVTMRVMRDEKEALMSVLRPFIHDPLVEWSRGDKSAKGTGEINNKEAQSHVLDIEYRLSGQIKGKTRALNLPLSVEGQVNYLIEEATSLDNLCQMYVGWAAYM